MGKEREDRSLFVGRGGEESAIAVCGKGRRGERDRCLGKERSAIVVWEGEESAIVVWVEEGSAIAVCVKWRGRDRCFGKGREARRSETEP